MNLRFLIKGFSITFVFILLFSSCNNKEVDNYVSFDTMYKNTSDKKLELIISCESGLGDRNRDTLIFAPGQELSHATYKYITSTQIDLKNNKDQLEMALLQLSRISFIKARFADEREKTYKSMDGAEDGNPCFLTNYEILELGSTSGVCIYNF